MSDNISQNIKRLRLERNLSQSALADLVGASQAQISNLENGISAGSWKLLERIAEHFDMTLIDLMADSPSEFSLEPA